MIIDKNTNFQNSIIDEEFINYLKTKNAKGIPEYIKDLKQLEERLTQMYFPKTIIDVLLSKSIFK